MIWYVYNEKFLYLTSPVKTLPGLIYLFKIDHLKQMEKEKALLGYREKIIGGTRGYFAVNGSNSSYK